MTPRTRFLIAVPAFGFVLAALVLALGAFASDEGVQARPAPQATANSMKPSDLSPTATTRDWQEMGGSGTKRK